MVYSIDTVVRYTYDEESKATATTATRPIPTGNGAAIHGCPGDSTQNRHADVENGLLNIDLALPCCMSRTKYDLTWENGGKTIYRFADGTEVDLRAGTT